MHVIKKFDPSAAVSGTIEVNAVNAGSKILLYNLSIWHIQINFEDGSTTILHAGEANWFLLDSTTPELTWQQYDSLNMTAVYSAVTGAVYDPNEPITGTYPMSLIYLMGIGNTVNVSQGSIQSIVQTGQPSGTSVVTATTAGDNSGDTIQLYCQGQMFLGSNNNSGVIAANGAGGEIYLNGNGANAWFGLTQANFQTVPFAWMDSSNNVNLQTGNGNVFNIRDSTGNLIATLDDSGIHVKQGALNLVTGKITAQAAGTVTGLGLTSPVTVTHGLPGTPRILATYDLGAGTSSSLGVIYVGNRNSTTFQIYGTSGQTIEWEAFLF